MLLQFTLLAGSSDLQERRTVDYQEEGAKIKQICAWQIYLTIQY